MAVCSCHLLEIFKQSSLLQHLFDLSFSFLRIRFLAKFLFDDLLSSWIGGSDVGVVTKWGLEFGFG